MSGRLLADAYSRKDAIVEKTCEWCKKTFNVPEYRDDTAKFCCKKCKLLSQKQFHIKTQLSNPTIQKEKRRSNMEEKMCPTCHTIFESEKYKNRKYCCVKCCNSDPLKKSDQRKRVSISILRDGPWSKGKSKETDERLKALSEKNSVIIQQMYDDGRIDLTKRKTDYVALGKKVSDTISRKLADGTLKNQYRFVKGWYDRKDGAREYYESSYEKAYMRDMDERSESWTKLHGIRIKYFDPAKNKERYYVPDFLVGGTEIREIKPLRQCDSPTNTAKFAAAREYCLTNNYTFAIITESEINL